MAMMLLLLLQLLILVIRFVAIVFVVARGLPTVAAAAAAANINHLFGQSVMAEKLLGIDLIEHVAGIVEALLRTHRLTSAREPDTLLLIDKGTEHEITVNEGLFEIAGFSQFPL